MTIELPEPLGARLAATAKATGREPAELAVWLLAEELEHIAKGRKSADFGVRAALMNALDAEENQPAHTLPQRFDDDFPLAPEDVAAISERVTERKEKEAS